MDKLEDLENRFDRELSMLKEVYLIVIEESREYINNKKKECL